MGTDIHILVEVDNGDGLWEAVEPPFYHEDWGGFYSFHPRYWKLDDNDPEKERLMNIPDPTTRDYNVFAFLANVRNGYGFAGVPRHKPIEPQFPDRGLPPGTTYPADPEDPEWTVPYNEGEEEYETPYGIWLGYHSLTWATLEELREAPWDMGYESTGVISASEYDSFIASGRKPPRNGWSGGVSGKGIRTFSEEEFLELRKEGEINYGIQEEGIANLLGEKDYVQVSWKWNPLMDSGFYRWLYGKWMNDLVADLDGDTSHIRILIGFDS